MNAAPTKRKPKVTRRRHRQHSVAVPDTLWDDALLIARLLDERDVIGDGLPVVVRRDLAKYVDRNQHVLDEYREQIEARAS